MENYEIMGRNTSERVVKDVMGSYGKCREFLRVLEFRLMCKSGYFGVKC